MTNSLSQQKQKQKQQKEQKLGHNFETTKNWSHRFCSSTPFQNHTHSLRPTLSIPLTNISNPKRYFVSSSNSYQLNHASELKTVPKFDPVSKDKIKELAHFINDCGEKLLVITGAGASTMSGIPDYRSPGVGLYVTTNHKPTQYHEFISSDEKRKRYWARNYMAFPVFSTKKPNATHEMLANLERTNRLSYLITQNVDRLHTVAGSTKLIELHGNGQTVICLKCKNKSARRALQFEFEQLNQGWTAQVQGFTPDGDVNLTNAQEAYASFRYPHCKLCGGLLKPDVVFFGENVPVETVEFCRDRIRDANGVLVVGSSLTVYSGYRFVKFAKDIQKKLAIVNIGETRADELADLKIDGNTSLVLESVCRELAKM